MHCTLHVVHIITFYLLLLLSLGAMPSPGVGDYAVLSLSFYTSLNYGVFVIKPFPQAGEMR